MADKDPWNPLEASISNQSAQKQPGLFRQTIDTLKGGEYKNWQAQGGLHSNQAINTFTGIPEMASRVFAGNQGLGDAFRETFYDSVVDEVVQKDGKDVIENGVKKMQKVGKGFRWGKMAGSVWAAGTALSAVGGAARGALTDKNGNFDIPGIPFI